MTLGMAAPGATMAIMVGSKFNDTSTWTVVGLGTRDYLGLVFYIIPNNGIIHIHIHKHRKKTAEMFVLFANETR